MSKEREAFTAMPKSRLEFICRLNGSPDGSPDGVPEDQREAWQEHIDCQDQMRLKLFENLCRHFGPTSFFEDIPDAAKQEAALGLRELAAHFEASCDYELRIFKIAEEEEAAAAAAVAPKRKRR